MNSIWDDGSPNPEPCPDEVAPHISEVSNPRTALILLDHQSGR